MRSFVVAPRYAMLARPCRRVQTAKVVAVKQPDAEPEHEREEPAHFVTVPQSVVIAIVRIFFRLLEYIQRR